MTRPDPFTRRTFDAAGNASAGWWARLATASRRVVLIVFSLMMVSSVEADCGLTPYPGLIFRDSLESCDAPGLQPGSSVHMLWVGNSLTNTPPDYNNYSLGPLPERLKPMLAERGVTLTYASAIQGGAEFSTHAANPATIEALGNAAFDIVNLQGYYEGFSSTQSYLNATQLLYNVAHGAGTDVLFEGMWPYLGDPGSPQHPTAALAVEGAAAARDRAFPVQVGRAWDRVRELYPSIHSKLRADSTHQSAAGEYLNLLVYTRFLTATSVADIQSVSTLAASQLTSSERAQMKAVVDEVVTAFYVPESSVPSSIAIETPEHNSSVTLGQSVTFRAVAFDVDRGDVSDEILWTDINGSPLHTGAEFSWQPPLGYFEFIARFTSQSGDLYVAKRGIWVQGATNTAPVASNKSQSIPPLSNFAQVNLFASVEDAEGGLNWSTLELDRSLFHGTSAAQNNMDPWTVDLDYTNGYRGPDLLRYRVADEDGAFSNWANIILDVQ